MRQRTLLVAIDLGTSSLTASHIIVNDSFTPEGKLCRDKGKVKISDIRDWPGGANGDAIGHVCVPTSLIYRKDDCKLWLWGFGAQQYLDDPYPDVRLDALFVVEHIKLLLVDSDDVTTSTSTSQRHQKLRDQLITTLGKQPEEVFEDFMNEVINHIIQSAIRRYYNGISSCNIELLLAFPSGWPDSLHTRVSGIGARAMAKAITANDLKDMVFGIENVYTVSETLCGVKEWLRGTIAEASASDDIDLNLHGKNFDELNEGDCLLAVDVGGGTGCMTLLRLVTKEPLRVDQLGPTHSLIISGEAVEAEFASWLQTQITSDDYPDDIPRLLFQICRKFKEEKKDCGMPSRPSSATWNISVPRLRFNADKGFRNGHMKIERSRIEKCFDPVIDTLQSVIENLLEDAGGIKTIVFLGQFGSCSEYLRKRMATSQISNITKVRYSESGKLNVVRGAISDRLNLSEGFVRKFQTQKSYGTLVTLSHTHGKMLFPNAKAMGAVPFEEDYEGYRLKVIEWAIPKGTVLEDGKTLDEDKDGPKDHTWRVSKRCSDFIEFEDIIVVSDEVPPPLSNNGKSYTLWTVYHEQNQLFINNQQVQIQQIPFSWNLSMSQKLDAAGNYLGAYTKEDMETFMFPEHPRKKVYRKAFKRLFYELVWNITEMQVKLHIRPLFPNPPGPLTTQLAKERIFEADETVFTGESRSQALERDIAISRPADLGSTQEASTIVIQAKTSDRATSDGRYDSAGLTWYSSSPLAEDTAKQKHQEQQSSSEASWTASWPPTVLQVGSQVTKSHINESINVIADPLQQSSPTSSRKNGRPRDGCYTCEIHKMPCDRKYKFNRMSGINSCETCIRLDIECYMTQASWNKTQWNAQKLERRHQIRLGKRKFHW